VVDVATTAAVDGLHVHVASVVDDAQISRRPLRATAAKRPAAETGSDRKRPDPV
jgi:hypothetical protein